MRVPLKSFVHFAGIIFMLLSLWLIVHKVTDFQSLLQLHLSSHPEHWLWLGGLSVCHGLLLNVLGLGWYDNLRHLRQKISLKQALSIYGISQLGKYLPGNVLHFAGRQWLAQRLQLQQSKVLQATMNEIAGHVLAVSLCILVLTSLNASHITQWLHSYQFIMRWLLVGVAVMLLTLSFERVSRSLMQYIHPLLAGFSLPSLSYYLVFHLIGGAMFVLVLHLLTPLPFSISLAMLAYALAWLVGFVVPGAPGGLGIREVILMALLAGVLPESVVLLAAIANRLITTLGDVWFFIESLALKHSRFNVEG